MRPLVVIENGVINLMIADHAIYPTFRNCLDLVVNAPAAKGCGKCQKAGVKDAGAYNDAKLCLSQLTDTRRQELKTALNAQQVRIVVFQNGERKTYTFA